MTRFLQRSLASCLAIVVVLTLVQAAASASPGVFPAPATGLLWINTNTGELSQWDLNGTNTVRGSTTWAMNCNYQTRCRVFDHMVGVAEMDGNPGHDLLTRETNSGSVILHTDAKLSGDFHWTASCGPECQDAAIGIRDFNKDGNQDVLWYNRVDGYPVISLFNGNGSSFSSITANESCNWECSKQWVPVGVGDINSDGYHDLLWWNTAEYSPGWLHAWLLNSNGQLVGKLNLSWQCADDCRASWWNPIGLGDINGDGTQDLMWHNFRNGQVATWLLDGHGTVTGQQYLDWRCDYDCSQTWRPIGIVDPEHRRPIRWP